MSNKTEQRSALDISLGTPVDGYPIKMKAFIHDFHNNTCSGSGNENWNWSPAIAFFHPEMTCHFHSHFIYFIGQGKSGICLTSNGHKSAILLCSQIEETGIFVSNHNG